jgi:hypothetical protein
MRHKDSGRETWREYAWYCLLFGTVGSAVVGAIAHSVDSRHTFFLDVAAVGVCIMGVLLVGWVLYALSRALTGSD